MWKRRRFLCAGLGAGGLLALRALGGVGSKQPLVEVRRSDRALGAPIEFIVYHEDTQQADRAIDAAFRALDQVEEVMSLYRPHSQLCRLNREGVLVNPHPWLVEVLDHARRLSAASDGAFDVTVQPLWLCWSRASRESRLPTAAELHEARRLVDWRRLETTPARVALAHPGMQVTLNGIAQGFAADRAIAALRDAGVGHALVNTGEIHALGTRPAGDHWISGIQHPRHDNAFVALTRFDGRALSTSGDYASAFTPDRQHHHILDPRQGCSPAELASVSVVAPTALEADALSTALLVLGMQRGLELIAGRAGVDALLVLKSGRMIATPGFPEEATA